MIYLTVVYISTSVLVVFSGSAKRSVRFAELSSRIDILSSGQNPGSTRLVAQPISGGIPGSPSIGHSSLSLSSYSKDVAGTSGEVGPSLTISEGQSSHDISCGIPHYTTPYKVARQVVLAISNY